MISARVIPAARVRENPDGSTCGAGGCQRHYPKPNKTTNIDHITDFVSGLDVIVLDKSVFKKLEVGDLKGKAFFAKKNPDEAKDGKDRIIYDTKSGELRYDKDGKDGVRAKLFGDADGTPDIDARDFLVVA